MKLALFQYQIESDSVNIELLPEGPLELSKEDFDLLTKLLYSPDSLALKPEDFVVLRFLEQDGTCWEYRLTAEGEQLLQDKQAPETITDLAHLIAIKWGVTSPIQLHNLLLLNPGEPTQSATSYLNKLTAIEEAIISLTGQSPENLRSELENVRSLHRKIAHVNGVRRLLWAKVCQVQEQTEKFAASIQGIIGSPVKPEYIAEFEQKKEQIALLDQQIAELNTKKAELTPEYDRYRRSLSMCWFGIAVVVLTLVAWYLAIGSSVVQLSLGVVAVLVFAFGGKGYLKTKEGADLYFACQDQLLDTKTELRRAKKELKKHLAGTDEAELIKKFTAQQEADRIRAELDYRLDRYTKAWQNSTPQSFQTQLVEANNRVFTLCEQTFSTEIARKIADHLSARQRLLVEVEAATHRENFFVQRDYDRPQTEKLVDPAGLIAILTPPEAPAISFVEDHAKPLTSDQEIKVTLKQLIIVRQKTV